MAVRAKLFMSCRSQVLRLPARFRFRGQEVDIEPMGQAFWVQPCGDASASMGQWFEAFYVDHPTLPETFLADRGDGQPQERDWS
jgi:antitoxin VapB